MADGSFRFAGSGLFFGDDSVEPKYAYVITARHVIDAIRGYSPTEEVWLRVNTKSGGCEWISTNLSRWICPADPSLDVAICYGSPTPDVDHMILHRQLVLTPTIANAQNVGVGDAIFITGLFANFTGDNRNVPIVRVGNLAAYPEEQIEVPIFGLMDAYLIEAHLFGGMSGSPVFYHAYASHVSTLRLATPQVYIPIPMPQPLTDDDVKTRSTQPFYLMGIVHGYFPAQKENTGIAIVVPVEKILNFVDAERSKR